MSRHPVLCKPVLEPLVDSNDFVAWRAGFGNGPPVAVDVDLGAVVEGQTLLWTSAALLAGARDPDGDALAVVSVAVSAGSVADNGNGTWTYTPPAGVTGPATVTIGVSDGRKTVYATGIVSVTPLLDASPAA